MLVIRQLIDTPYGAAQILEINETHVKAEPISWVLAGNQKPTFYLNINDVKPKTFLKDFTVKYNGEYAKVLESFEKTIKISNVEEIEKKEEDSEKKEEETEKKEEETEEKQAETEKKEEETEKKEEETEKKNAEIKKEKYYKISFYNKETNDFEVPPRVIDVLASDPALEFVDPYQFFYLELAVPTKEIGSAHFAKKNYEASWNAYQLAIDYIVKNIFTIYKEPIITNFHNSDFFTLTVTCFNNMGLCAYYDKKYDLAIDKANDSVTNIRSLKGRIRLAMSDIWKELTLKGFTYTKLQELELKALRIVFLSCLAKKSFPLADKVLIEANNILKTEKDLVNYTETWTKLENQLKAQKKSADEKEKRVWEAAFKKNKTSTESMYSDDPQPKKEEKESIFDPNFLTNNQKITTAGDMNEILTKFMQDSSQFSQDLKDKKLKKTIKNTENEEEVAHGNPWYSVAALGFAALSIGAYFFLRNKK